jgi:hypothetical protein
VHEDTLPEFRRLKIPDLRAVEPIREPTLRHKENFPIRNCKISDRMPQASDLFGGRASNAERRILR